MSTDLHSLWDAIKRNDTREIASHLFPRGPQQPMPGIPALVEGPSPTAGIGTADAGTPIVRYWTVKFERGGRTHYDHVIACDPWKAQLAVFKRQAGSTSTQVVREIDREEYEHLTRSAP